MKFENTFNRMNVLPSAVALKSPIISHNKETIYNAIIIFISKSFIVVQFMMW